MWFREPYVGSLQIRIVGPGWDETNQVDEVLYVDLGPDPSGWSRDEMDEALKPVITEYMPNYNRRVTENVYSSGAAAEWVQYALDIISSVPAEVVGAAVWTALVRVARNYADSASRDVTVPTPPLTRDEAVQQARWHLGTLYKVNGEDLRLVEDEGRDDGTWTVVFETDDARFELDLDKGPGYAYTSRVRRTTR